MAAALLKVAGPMLKSAGKDGGLADAVGGLMTDGGKMGGLEGMAGMAGKMGGLDGMAGMEQGTAVFFWGVWLVCRG